MNIALGALIIILLLIPSITFKFGIRSNLDLKELTSTNSIADAFWLLILIPIIIHLLFTSFLNLIGYEIKFDLLVDLIKDDKYNIVDNYAFFIDIRNFLFYIIITSGTGYGLGLILNAIITETHGIKPWALKLIGTRNQWCRLFDGQILTVSGEIKGLNERIDLIKLDILTQHNPFPVLYSGLFVNYYLKRSSNDLEVIVLQSAFKRHVEQTDATNVLSTDSFTDAEEIPGHYFIIPAEKILNINIDYITLSNIEDNQIIDDACADEDGIEDQNLQETTIPLENERGNP